MTQREIGLQKVQELYLLQFQLFGLLDADLAKPEKRREALKQTREFESLLASADWRYMGGEDVYEEMKKLPTEMKQRVKTTKKKKKVKQ